MYCLQSPSQFPRMSPIWQCLAHLTDELKLLLHSAILHDTGSLPAEDVEQELMELWSNVEKERASQQEMVALRGTWRSDDSRRRTTDPDAIQQRKAAGPNGRTGFAHEATLLKDVSAEAATGEDGRYLHGTKEHAAQPANSEAQVSSSATARHETQLRDGYSMIETGEQGRSLAPGVQSCSPESAHIPGDGSRTQAFASCGKGELLTQSKVIPSLWMLCLALTLLDSSCRPIVGGNLKGGSSIETLPCSDAPAQASIM